MGAKSLSGDDLKIVVIDCPMRYLSDPFVRDIFAKIAQLKVAGFQTLDSKYFAFDKQDLVATHIMAGEFNEQGDYQPLIAYKAMSEEQSLAWDLPFDGFDVVKQSQSQLHIDAISDYIQNLKDKGKRVGYQSSLTVDPNIECRKKSVELLKILQSMAARYIVDFDVDASICIAREKVKSAKLFEKFGFQKIKKNNEVLPTLTCPQYQNNQYFLMVFDQLTHEGEKLVSAYDSQWRNRIEISERMHSRFRNDKNHPPGVRRKVS